MEIKTLLKNRRIELGLTMKDVAKACSVTEATVSRWESGEIENMRRDKIVSLANVLSLSPSEIMGWPASVSFQISPAERELISAYRRAPESRREAVRALLEIKEKTDVLENTEYSVS